MVTLIDFKNIFKKWGYFKEKEDSLFDEEIKKLKHNNGSLYWQEDME